MRTRTGACPEEILADYLSVIKTTCALSDVEAAAFYVNYSIAWLFLIDGVHLKETNTVLIHDARGSPGLAPIEIAKLKKVLQLPEVTPN